MNARTKLLAGVAAAIGLLYMLNTAYESWIEQPRQRTERQIDEVSRKLKDSEVAQRAALRKVDRLEEYAERSLPHDRELARSRYQEWLLKLVEKYQLTAASIDPGNPVDLEVASRGRRSRRRTIGYSLNFTLRAKTNLEHLADFLHHFQRSGQLHRITNLTLTPLGGGSELDVVLSIQALGLDASERAGQLSDWMADPETQPPRPAFQSLVNRNIFARGISRSLAVVTLRALTVNSRGESEAWFATGPGRPTQIVSVGQVISLPLQDLAVVAIEQERVKIELYGAGVWLGLGQSLADALGIVIESAEPGDETSDAELPGSLPPESDAQTTTTAEVL
jgi:hypothetical protein